MALSGLEGGGKTIINDCASIDWGEKVVLIGLQVQQSSAQQRTWASFGTRNSTASHEPAAAMFSLKLLLHQD